MAIPEDLARAHAAACEALTLLERLATSIRTRNVRSNPDRAARHVRELARAAAELDGLLRERSIAAAFTKGANPNGVSVLTDDRWTIRSNAHESVLAVARRFLAGAVFEPIRDPYEMIRRLNLAALSNRSEEAWSAALAAEAENCGLTCLIHAPLRYGDLEAGLALLKREADLATDSGAERKGALGYDDPCALRPLTEVARAIGVSADAIRKAAKSGRVALTMKDGRQCVSPAAAAKTWPERAREADAKIRAADANRH